MSLKEKILVDDEKNSNQIRYDFSKEKQTRSIKIDEAGTRLTKLMRIPEVKAFFKKNEYAVSFKSNDCIILPIVYQNIYKGALGEAAGRAILEANGIYLSEITDVSRFEKFDYCLKRDPDIYVDFKNWSDQDKVSRNAEREKCMEKLNRINGKKVFIINLVADNFAIHSSFNDRIIEISTLCRSSDDKKLLYQLYDNDKKKVLTKLLED